MNRVAAALLAAPLALPSLANAQALQCSTAAAPTTVRPDRATAGQPVRRLPIGSYTLAITWSPQYCRDHARDASARFQCGTGNRFGFTLHGLWPDGVGREWPQYCRSTALLPARIVQPMLCTTPSAQLIQHEWAKHGTCMPGTTPATYFARARSMFAQLQYPDMIALSRRPLTAGGLAAAIARENPGLRADMMRVTATRQGWLDEIWLCYDRRFRATRCPAHAGGLAPAAAVKIWRGRD
ncbi:MAG TPA: ribonuclease T [Sphingomonas sp.]|nr:ribonuclease T [Sphingomonas sp.]